MNERQVVALIQLAAHLVVLFGCVRFLWETRDSSRKLREHAAEMQKIADDLRRKGGEE